MESTASGQDFMEQLLFGRIQLAGLEGVKTGTKKKILMVHVPLSLSLYIYIHIRSSILYGMMINYRFFPIVNSRLQVSLHFLVSLLSYLYCRYSVHQLYRAREHDAWRFSSANKVMYIYLLYPIYSTDLLTLNCNEL